MLSEHLAVIIESLGAGAVVNDYNKIGSAAARAGKETTDASMKSSAALKAGIIGGVALAGAAVVGFVKEGISHFIEFTDQARLLEQRTGASAQSSSRLAFAMRELGVDIDSGATALSRFGRNAIENADKFAKLGVTIEHTKTGAVDVEGTLLNVADRFQAVGGGAEGSTLALQLFGKGGAALIPILAQGREGLERFNEEAKRFGLVFDQSQIDKGFQLKLAMTELKTSMEALSVQAILPLVDHLTRLGFGLVEAAKKAITLGGILDVPHGDKFLGGVVSSLPYIGPVIGGLEQMGKKGADSAKELAKHAMAEATDAAAAQELASAIQQANAALETQAMAAAALPLALLSDKLAMRQVDQQIGDLTKKDDSLARARQDAARATQDDAEAHRKYNELLADTGALTRELLRDERDLHSAQLADADAKQAQADAVAHLNHMLSVGAGPEEIAKAQRGVDEANIKVEDSTLSVADASKKLHDAQTGESDTAKALKDAKRAQEDADRRVVDSTNAVRSAIEKQAGKELELQGLLLRKAQIAEDVAKRVAAAAGTKPNFADVANTEIFFLKLLEREYPQFTAQIESAITAIGLGTAAAAVLTGLIQTAPQSDLDKLLGPVANPALVPPPALLPGFPGTALAPPKPPATDVMSRPITVNVTTVPMHPIEVGQEVAWAVRGAA